VGDPIVVSGTAAPNAKVKVYVFSTPQTAEVTANASGKWTYTLPALPAGAHHIEAAIISSDGTEGPRQVLGAFTVVAKKTAHPVLATLTTPAKKTSGLSPAGLLLIAGLSLLAIAYIVWYWWHHRSSILNHHKKGDQDSTTPSNPTPTFTPGN
jgi:hypothetical protein